MTNYRRARLPGGIFFFTVVTHHRRPILTTPLAREVLRQAFREVRGRQPFSVEAIVLLPDHLHCVWALPDRDTDFSTRWRQIKTLFTRRWLQQGGREAGSPRAGSRNWNGACGSGGISNTPAVTSATCSGTSIICMPIR